MHYQACLGFYGIPLYSLATFDKNVSYGNAIPIKLCWFIAHMTTVLCASGTEIDSDWPNTKLQTLCMEENYNESLSCMEAGKATFQIVFIKAKHLIK